MGIQGFVECLEPARVVGWAMDDALPEIPVRVVLRLDGAVIQEVAADGWREDLARNGVGTGYHGFVAQFAHRLDAGECARLSVSVVGAHGGETAIGLYLADEAPAQSAAVPFEALRADPDAPGFVPCSGQRPVFVLGARRSGTSAVAHAIFLRTRYKGAYEGHLFDLITPLARAVNSFFDAKQPDILQPLGTTLIGQVPKGQVANELVRMFRGIAEGVSPGAHWIDKTPTPDMIRAVPTLASIWPEARFIFVRRRAFENLASQQRKFPAESFRSHCAWWAECMSAWLEVRDGVRGRAIEVDQRLLATDPSRAGRMIGGVLALDHVEQRDMTWFLANRRPEQTATGPESIAAGPPADWTEVQARTFDVLCRPLFAPFGYAEDARYFVSDDPDLAGRVI